jgi:hypothetical protein
MFNLKDITSGTEKQNKWAMDLRANEVKNLMVAINVVTKNGTKELAPAAVTMIENALNAKNHEFWINRNDAPTETGFAILEKIMKSTF